MKALVLADRPPHINIREIIQREQVELIITLGDLEQSDLVELEYVTNIPKIGIYGNHCGGTYMEPLGITNMHGVSMTVQGVTFAGMEGCVRYKPDPTAIMYTQEQATQLLAGAPPVDVFITHCPPRGVNDEDEITHQGWDALREYVLTQKPRMLLHGHTYPTDETLVTKLGDTDIVYVHGWKIVDLPASNAS